MTMTRTAGAALLALLSTAALATAAQAKDGFYLAPSAGLMMPSDVDVTLEGISGSVDYDNGYVLGLALGYRLGMFRVEGELGYAEQDGATVKAAGQSLDADFETGLVTATVAGFVDFDLGPVKPYVGAGLGYGWSTVEIAGLDDLDVDDTDSNFIMFGEAGVALPISDTIEIVPSYRYLWANNGGDGFEDDSAHLLRVGMRVSF